MWAGTGGAGLTRFRPRAIVTHDDKEGLPSLIVNSVYEDVPGQILVGGTGLRRLAQGRFSSAIESGDANGMAGGRTDEGPQGGTGIRASTTEHAVGTATFHSPLPTGEGKNARLGP